LAREGYAVLVHDTFLWGSRKMPLASMPEWDRTMGLSARSQDPRPKGEPAAVGRYNCSAIFNEHTIAKYCNVLGTSFPGVVSFEDRVAVNYLASRRDVDASRIGCIGLSGGGTRAVLLQATCDRIRAAVVVGAMCCYAGALDHNIVCHTWMLFPPAWGRYGDWPDIAACRAPSPLLVQNDLEDALYTVAGMRESHRRIAAHYRSLGAPANYVGEFYRGPHKFDLPMQKSAFAWLARWLKR
jgi:dienelactone hydrolase